MDDYPAVRDLLPAPSLPPEVERAGRDRLAAAFAQEWVRRGRRSARWSALALGLAGATAAAIVIANVAPAGVPVPQGAVAQADGKRFLLVAAASVAAVPDEGAWWGSTEVQGRQFHEPGGRYVLRESESVETWIPADPAGLTWYRQTPHGIKPATPPARARAPCTRRRSRADSGWARRTSPMTSSRRCRRIPRHSGSGWPPR
ncbi:hypothetical protein AB0M50_24650 [Nonomuraea fuscirosea]|uniref:hypothetical protein n=1 Tax=Nonomuraea fuscirosea TaxID=1291556 RepID=UPI003418E363